MSDKPKVQVTGFFDTLRPGHIKFFEDASEFGELHVVIGSDENSVVNKGKLPLETEEKYKYMVESIKHVHKAHVPQSTSILDFISVAEKIKPDSFVINEDGNTIANREFAGKIGMK